jgi:hypothetical protein
VRADLVADTCCLLIYVLISAHVVAFGCDVIPLYCVCGSTHDVAFGEVSYL